MYPYPVKQRTSLKAASFTESVIREMSREALAHGAINLAQGFPDFPAPDFIKRAAVEAIEQDLNQYAITWGAPSLRNALSRKMGELYHLDIDPDREITVCCGSTEGMISALLAVVNPGDEVIVFEPYYENYGPDTILCGAVPRFVRLHPPDFALDEEELRAAFSSKTKAIIINTPNNPSGKVFSAEELATIAHYCREYDVLALTDEIYEHIIYDGLRHTPMATIEGMRDRTITISGISKTFSVTGWRVGYVIAPPDITGAVRKVHDFLTVGTAAPLQEAAARAIASGGEYYRELGDFYARRRDYFLGVLRNAGFACHSPAGAYYIMADISPWRCSDDVAFAKYLTREIGVAAVPGSSFYNEKGSAGAGMVRFTFCKKMETLEAAAERLRKLNTA
ncbi:MAG: aminotransferase class I/II-fold pyridoxal phosphate-dependent enzyme [Alphaproteobacteria bacterium]|uniref:Aminotransferase n=1 Tax=Candidatus Nitrobium versatile TaxID=2884831 RepID=A0A953J6V4_9BACT|nr:aminotransferase class I/II-fold pyridoxal phosphate-dependent enzyme [Candidatus Nitrobium versatile]